MPIKPYKFILFEKRSGKRKINSSQNSPLLSFRFFPCLHYFVNISANLNSIIKFLYTFQQPMEWAVRKCPQLFLRMLWGLRNGQKTIRTFFWNTLYKEQISLISYKEKIFMISYKDQIFLILYKEQIFLILSYKEQIFLISYKEQIFLISYKEQIYLISYKEQIFLISYKEQIFLISY